MHKLRRVSATECRPISSCDIISYLLGPICRGTLQVAVDGAHVLEYHHRVALQRIDTLCISGKVKVTAIGILPSSVSLSKLSCWLFDGLNQTCLLLLFAEFCCSQSDQSGARHEGIDQAVKLSG